MRKLGITDLLLNPNDTSELWVTLGGFDDPTKGTDIHNRVFYSHDGGLNFEDISAGLPNFPVNCIAYWNNGNDGLFAGTDIGVYYKDKNLTEWQPFNQELPKTIVMELEILENEEVIRAATFGRGIYEADLSCEYDPVPLVITTDTTFLIDVTMDRSIVVESPAILTIQSEVRFPPQARIIVNPGAELIVDGGTLTNTCYTMWQGIEARGVSSLPQIPLSNQSLVVITNGAIVKNARIAISNAGARSNGDILWDSVGGIIRTYDATFENNYKDIQILPNRSNTSESRFYNTTFKTSRRLVDTVSYPSDHVSLYAVNGVGFYGCTFMNSVLYPAFIQPNRFMRGNGIRSINASFGVYRLCDEGSPPCSNPDTTLFSGLNYGIYTANSDQTCSVTIKDSKFLNNYRGIYVNSADYSAITSNSFKVRVPGGAEENDTTYGLFIGNSTGYHIEGNSIDCPGNELFQNPMNPFYPRQIGIIIDNSGGDPNEIYRNYFKNLDIAINAQRVNRFDQEPNYTGLVLKCNTYNDNSYDEMVTRENPTGVEGIAFHQGDPTPSSGQDLAGNTFSPYHETAQIPETDIKNEGNFINYYHHNLHPDYRVKPEYYTLSLVLPVQKNYDFYTTDCPSCLGSGGSQEEMKDAMAAETDSIDLLLTGLASIVDGGDTEGMNDDIFFSTPPDALSLHQDLLGESPYLSDTVIKSSIAKEEVLPNAMIRDILVANPQSSKSTEVMDKLNERFIPMPDPMMDEILAGQTQISAKEILEGKIAVHELNRKNLFSKLVRSYKSDTINMSSQDSLISMLQGEISLKAKYLLAFEFLGTDDTAQVINTLNSIPGNFTLTGARQALHNDYQEYFEVLLGLKSENRSILELDSGQMTTLQDLVTLGHEPVKSYARNILLANQLFEYHEPILLPELNNPSGSKPITISEQQTSNTYFRLYPNPTNQYAIIEYCLAEYSDSQKSSIFVITTQEGKVIDRIMVNKQQDQFILNTTGYLPGTYLCTMFYEGKSLQSQKFVIIR